MDNEYCLACGKEGHFTNDCHSTHALNSQHDFEIDRLCMIANRHRINSSYGNNNFRVRVSLTGKLILQVKLGTDGPCEDWRDANQSHIRKFYEVLRD